MIESIALAVSFFAPCRFGKPGEPPLHSVFCASESIFVLLTSENLDKRAALSAGSFLIGQKPYVIATTS